MKRLIVVFIGVLLMGVVSQPAGVAASRTGSGAWASEGSSPVAVEQIRPWTAAASADGVPTAPSQHPPKNVPLAGVDRATYQREKAAAVRGSAPARPTVVKTPTAQPQASMPTLFDGLDRPTAGNFVPPDTIVGKSPNRVLEGVNSALRLSNTAGGAAQVQTFDRFFGPGFLYDPKVYFDRNSPNPRFFVVALQVAGRGDSDPGNDVSRIWLAVSRSPDPADLSPGNWCRYNIEGRRNIGTTDVSWADYPAIGAGQDSFSIATNQFRFPNDAFTFAVVHVFNKNVVTNNAASCPTINRFTFQPSGTAGDFSRFTIQPAQQYTSPSSFPGTTNPAYYLSTTRGSSNQYRVYRVRNVASGSPLLDQIVLTGTGYGIPPNSPQPGSNVLIDTGDNRVLQTAGLGNTLIGTLTTVCNFTAGTPNESCSLTPRISVGQNATGGLTATTAENTLAGFGNDIFVHHNGVAVNSVLQLGATWEFSGPTRFLSSAAMIKNVSAIWTGVATYASGSCALPVSPQSAIARSGDYTGAQTDPGDLTTYWLAGEQAVVIAGNCQWRTRIGRLVP